MDLTRPRRSYSRLSTYAECPEMYKYKYVERVPEQPSVWTVGGTAFHTFAENYLNGEIEDSPDHRWLAWQDAWLTALDEQKARYPDVPVKDWRAADRGRENAKWWEQEGYAMAQRFHAWRQGAGADLQVVALEEEIEVELGGVPVIAIPDWIAVDEHGQACIVDYKSSKDQAGPKKPLQLGVYRAAVMAKLGYEPVWGLYYMARSAAVIPWDLRKYTPELIGEKFADFDSRERAGDYRPTPGDHCRYCPFKRDRCTYYNPETT